MKSGIYCIKNIINDKMYIGSAVNLKTRRYEHFHFLTKNKHHNRHLQSSYNKYGKENFVWEVLEYVDDANNLIPKENEYILKFNKNDLYNICVISPNTLLGVKHTDETKLKIGLKQLGRKASIESRQKMSLAQKGSTKSKSK
jgi:group I intron endonuclease